MGSVAAVAFAAAIAAAVVIFAVGQFWNRVLILMTQSKNQRTKYSFEKRRKVEKKQAKILTH